MSSRKQVVKIYTRALIRSAAAEGAYDLPEGDECALAVWVEELVKEGLISPQWAYEALLSNYTKSFTWVIATRIKMKYIQEEKSE